MDIKAREVTLVHYIADTTHVEYIAGQEAALMNSQLPSPEHPDWIYSPYGATVQWGLGHQNKMTELGWQCGKYLPPA